MFPWRLLLILLFCLTLGVKGSQARQNIVLSLQADVYRDYLCLLKQRSILDISDYKGPCSRRDVVEILLIQQALLLGGFVPKITFVPGEYGERNKRLLANGSLLLSVDTFWLSEANKQLADLYVSAPMIRLGEYVAGVYTIEQRQDVLAVRSLEELQGFTAVSNHRWLVDWRVLQKLELKALFHESVWSAHVQMVKHGYADFMLAPITDKADFNYELSGVKIIPVPNIAVLLDDSRHFVVSKKHPLGKQAITAMDKGIAIMRTKGLIQKAYMDSGFFYPIEQGWKILNPNIVHANN